MTPVKPMLIITRGLPGSGKTTWAQAMVLASAGLVTRVNRDDLRASLFGVTGKTVLLHHEEEAITAVQRTTARALLDSGRTVIIDDTNLRLRYARAWADLAVEAGVEFVVDDRFLDVPLDRCIAQDAGRPGGVGEAVIVDMHAKFLAGGRKLPRSPRPTPQRPPWSRTCARWASASGMPGWWTSTAHWPC
jgi:predicted kinase